MMVNVCFLKEKTWWCLSLAQAQATVLLWWMAPRISAGLDWGRVLRTLAWDAPESLFTSEPSRGGSELFLEARRTQVGRCDKSWDTGQEHWGIPHAGP